MTVIKIKNSNVTGRLPSSGDIEVAELAINIADKKLYSKDAAGAIFEIGAQGDLPSGPNPPSSGNNIGDLFFDTTEGNLVYWDGSAWIPIVGDQDGEGYVNVSGDNMTGDLTLGDGTTDKITLDATAGNASFAGDLDAGAGIFNNGKAKVFVSSGDAGLYVYDTADTGTPTAIINKDGSATFAAGVKNDASGTGYIQTAGVGGLYGYVYARESNSGSFTALNYTADGNQAAFVAEGSGGNTLAKIDWLGGATFAGTVAATPTDAYAFCLGDPATPSGGLYIGGDAAGSLYLSPGFGNPATVSITGADGSANFAGDVEVAGNPANGATDGARIFNNGNLQLARTQGASDLITGYTVGTATPTVQISADGGAIFSGYVYGGALAITEYAGCFINSGVYGSAYDVNITSRNYTGAGDPAANIIFGGLKSNSLDYVEWARVTPSGIAFHLEADDDTKYTSTTDSEGNVNRVYNGEVLDVKDRLTKADNALKALKTAAAAATTIADLKNAIATALADV